MVRGITGTAGVALPLEAPEVLPPGVGRPFLPQRQRLVGLVIPGTKVAVPVNLQVGVQGVVAPAPIAEDIQGGQVHLSQGEAVLAVELMAEGMILQEGMLGAVMEDMTLQVIM